MGEGFLSKMFSADKSQSAFSAGVADPIKAQIVIDTISDGIAIIDANGIIQLFNPAAEGLTGWKASDAVGLDYRSIFTLLNSAEHEVEPANNPITITMSSAKVSNSDNVYILTASKKKVQISLKATPIMRPDGNNGSAFEGIVIVFRDITMERAAQNAQTDFISTASHEMRTPVATIEGYLGMILNPNICTIDDKARDYANKSHEAIARLGRLFQDLLDVTKADDNRLQLRPTLIDAVAATRLVVDSFQQQAQAKGLELRFDDGANNVGSVARVIAPPSIIYVDLDHFNEALGNIVENAIKYTKSGGVDVKVANQNNRCRIMVTDTGIGIPPEDIPHLFQKFYRVDNSETRTVGGTGLGLYLIKKITTSMGGTVGVESEYGQGSTFWMEFNNLTREQAIQYARQIKAANHERAA